MSQTVASMSPLKEVYKAVWGRGMVVLHGTWEKGGGDDTRHGHLVH